MNISKRKLRQQEKLLKKITRLEPEIEKAKKYDEYIKLKDKYIETIAELRRNYIPPVSKSKMQDSFYFNPDSFPVEFFRQQRHLIDFFAGIGNLSYPIQKLQLKATFIDIDEDAMNLTKKLNKYEFGYETFCYKLTEYVKIEDEYIVEDLFSISEERIRQITTSTPFLPLCLVNPPFSKSYKKQTFEFLEKLFNATPDGTEYLIILPSSWEKDLMKIKPEDVFYEEHYKCSVSFTNTDAKAHSYVFFKEKACSEIQKIIEKENKYKYQLTLF